VPDREKPKLLSGGNPQIAKGYGPEPVRAYIDAMPGWKRDVGATIAALTERLVPDVEKAVKWNSPFYGRACDCWFLSFHCFTRFVKVTFFDGHALDPPPPKSSKHEKVRFFHIHEGDRFEDPLEHWIAQAAELPGEKM
jgi:hypothetical protein